jgi:sugar lactone lactonase YvrE
MFLFGVAMAATSYQTSPGVSVYPRRLEDPRAVYVKAAADGMADDTVAIQQAVDKVQEAQGSGIVFLPSGRYRISDTIRVWPGIRVIGFGPTRPTLFLAPNTPGYQEAEKYMVFFAGRRPRGGQPLVLDHPRGQGLNLEFNGEASPGTFYSAMDNVDLEVGEGNPTAVGVRGRYAQHCYLAHMDFRLGSAMAGIHDTGNVGFDLRFFGGKSGIITRTPSPGWQFTLLDSVFEGQSEAAIRTYETGLTLIRPTFRHVPSAVSVEPDHSEMLWMSDARLEDITGPAIVIGRENSLRTQINVERASCLNVPVFASMRESGTKLEGKGPTYLVSSLLHGSKATFEHDEGAVVTEFHADPVAELPAPAKSDIRSLPDPSTWVSLTDLGAKGDGEFDNTAILQEAIDKHQAIYLPQGKYRVTQTIRLRPDTVLIGLHPFTTQILIKDGTPAFAGIESPLQGEGGYRSTPTPFPGNPVPLLEAPKGGDNVLTGIGLDTGGNNPAATAAKWSAGADSMINDVKFLGGHGSVPWNEIYNANHSADPNPARRWDSQFASLWVTDGGGGTFLNIWTASTFAAAGMEVSNTSTEGRVYELSSEHHVRNEIKLRNASHWNLFSVQTEEERGESGFAVPVDIESCFDIRLANTVMYRVISMEQTYPHAIRIANLQNVRIQNIHCNSNSKAAFDSLVVDASTGAEYRTREVANFTVALQPLRARHLSNEVTKLAGGFFNISGGAVDKSGDFYFVDARFQRIYRWDAEHGGVSTVRDDPLWPVNLFFDDDGNMVVVSYVGTGMVFATKPKEEMVTLLKPQPSSAQAGKTYVLPVTDFELNRDLIHGQTQRWPSAFASPDGSTLLPVDQGFLNGELSWGVKAQAVVRSFGLAKAKPGDTFYVSGENNLRTYSATVEPDGSLSNGKLFAEQGGEGVAVDSKGNVYLAAGQIYVYSRSGKLIREIRVPERPIQIVFGGHDGKTLFIAARTSLYAVQVP